VYLVEIITYIIRIVLRFSPPDKSVGGERTREDSDYYSPREVDSRGAGRAHGRSARWFPSSWEAYVRGRRCCVATRARPRLDGRRQLDRKHQPVASWNTKTVKKSAATSVPRSAVSSGSNGDRTANTHTSGEEETGSSRLNIVDARRRCRPVRHDSFVGGCGTASKRSVLDKCPSVLDSTKCHRPIIINLLRPSQTKLLSVAYASSRSRALIMQWYFSALLRSPASLYKYNCMNSLDLHLVRTRTQRDLCKTVIYFVYVHCEKKRINYPRIFNGYFRYEQ